MRQKQVKKGPDESGPAAGDQKGNACKNNHFRWVNEWGELIFHFIYNYLRRFIHVDPDF
ncbi:hypothetical protein [Aeromonas caviae]|uniref:hypothetical protein n=1 Tax=Aeromonas caviae TaxID=648 RepID=UPI003EC4E7CD